MRKGPILLSECWNSELEVNSYCRLLKFEFEYWFVNCLYSFEPIKFFFHIQVLNKQLSLASTFMEQFQQTGLMNPISTTAGSAPAAPSTGVFKIKKLIFNLFSYMGI